MIRIVNAQLLIAVSVMSTTQLAMFTIIVIIFVYFLATSFTNAFPIVSKPKSTLDEHVVLQPSDAESLRSID